MKKTLCQKCNNSFSNKGGNYNKHIKVCDGLFTKEKLECCKYCSLSFASLSVSEKANHSRWCTFNPKRDEWNHKLNEIRSHITTESRKAVGERVKQLHREGRYDSKYEKQRGRPGTKHTEETKQILREKALASNHRRLQRNIQTYNGIMMDSKWEVELAKRLDDLNIKWIRPGPIKWIDKQGISHNYFPDFYLPDYDLYLDPKNPQAIRVQKEKLDCLSVQYSNIVILESLEQCKSFII